MVISSTESSTCNNNNDTLAYNLFKFWEKLEAVRKRNRQTKCNDKIKFINEF